MTTPTDITTDWVTTGQAISGPSRFQIRHGNSLMKGDPLMNDALPSYPSNEEISALSYDRATGEFRWIEPRQGRMLDRPRR